MSKPNVDSANHGPPPPVSAGYQRSGSMDMGERHSQPSMRLKSSHAPYARGYSYPPPQYPSSRPPPHQIQSVVTTSFSMEEEREDGSSRLPPGTHSLGHPADYRSPMDERHPDSREISHHPRSASHVRESSHHAREPPHHGREPPLYSRELTPVHETERERERHPPTHDMMRSRPMTIPPSPRVAGGERPPYIQRAHSAGAPSSSGSYRGGQGPLKRSFWHHARPGDEYQSSLPHEFMPPKRSKISPSMRKDFVMTARPHPDDMHPSDRHNIASSRPTAWFNRAPSWESSEEYFHRVPKSKSFPSQWSRHSPPYREGEVGPHWSEAPPIPSPRARYSPSEGSAQYERSAGPPWSHPRPTAWHPHSMSPEMAWRGPQNRDEAESKHHWPDARDRDGMEIDFRRQGTFESGSETDSYHQNPIRLVGPPPPPHGMEHGTPPIRRSLVYASTDSRKMTDVDSGDRSKKDGPIRLLALPEDRISLSETLCVVRENIEVFTATLNDVEAPAPGRKHAVVVGQVGLRCIHCRHTTRSSERVKRAVCYPSSIKRIYRTVIDMKLDHFLHCKFVPDGLKDTLAALKANNTRSTGTTMQYFIRAASTLGMVDGPTGVRLVEHSDKAGVAISPPTPPQRSQGNTQTPASSSSKTSENPSKSSPGNNKSDTPQSDCRIGRNNSMSSESTHSSLPAVDETGNPKEVFTGKITLALPEDKMSLSPLRCFLREQVCAFSATEEDIAVRTPTTFSVSVGQVGIGCIHCLTQPAKLRLNRAVCFPFSIARIYQSVADIQRFHLGECKMVPDDVKAKFLALQSASSKGSKGLATRQYWVTSAKKIGLVDTARGIRFGRDPSLPEKKSISLDILAQVASNVTTANKPLVLPEDKPFIAEFLYVVMEQLQPCRFTEADRNKRRLKDVGCIGVECKHCAGQVDSRKFFWSSVNAVESNFVSVHTHMMECRMIPDPLKEKLAELKKLRKEQTAALKTGSQKAFFSRVWKRLHVDETQNPPEASATTEAKASKPTSSDESMKKPASPTPSQTEKEETKDMSPASSPSSKGESSSNVEAVSDKMAVVSV